MSDDEKVQPTGPVGPAGWRWTYLRPYGAGDRYQAELYRSHGSDDLYFLEVGKSLPFEAKDDSLDLSFDREDVDRAIKELI